MSWTNEQIQEAAQAVVGKAISDAEFRKLAISDIYAAIKQVTGREVPQEFKINVIDGTGYHANIVLPEVRGAADELTETELEAVAGGSKDGATRFFEGVGSILEDGARTAISTGSTVAINMSNK
ncbi:hypothetical protein PAECIP111893_00706 [Paenibacillus plantiphilus]|uniref:NHLP leader peptide family natural product n=1 Tax=Paenibacillus plantiphilus TaxID=2905650 RepID=A0ABN8FZK6_9BACL|nr:NHLP leader peptide family RiPP precursor [Paenibacillus plantiphilus]CAH1195504.1 hypothetical protein PAECIP111893_00706 [Paenibacillus plantiphilus]